MDADFAAWASATQNGSERPSLEGNNTLPANRLAWAALVLALTAVIAVLLLPGVGGATTATAVGNDGSIVLIALLCIAGFLGAAWFVSRK